MKPDSRSDSIIKVACGMYHTVALTNASTLYSWGSPHAFSPLPRVLRRRARANGDICSGNKERTLICIVIYKKYSGLWTNLYGILRIAHKQTKL